MPCSWPARTRSIQALFCDTDTYTPYSSALPQAGDWPAGTVPDDTTPSRYHVPPMLRKRGPPESPKHESCVGVVCGPM